MKGGAIVIGRWTGEKEQDATPVLKPFLMKTDLVGEKRKSYFHKDVDARAHRSASAQEERSQTMRGDSASTGLNLQIYSRRNEI